MIQHSDTVFLEELGQRVLTARSLRGLSRKTLAQASGISERYIALLESGKGNISIVLLRRVSNAMAIPLTDLIPTGKPVHRRIDAAPLHAPAG
jgi:XRE family aerobic/anaerobic benzoate catabolism transcriptional regulator